MSLLSNLLHLPSIGYRVLRNAQQQKRFIRQHLQPEIEEARQTNDGSLSERDFTKILRFYGYIIPAFLGDSYCVLRGKNASQQEQLALTYQGALTGLFDDFFDEREMSEEELMGIINHPDQVEGKDSNERLFLQFYRKSLTLCQHPEQVKYYLREVYDAQVLSLRQLLPEIPQSELLDITIRKGGMSFLFYRAAYDHELKEPEINMLYKLGGVMQLNSDVFDIYKDMKSGVRTLATEATSIAELRETILQLQQESFQLAYEVGYPRSQVQRFLRFLSLVNSRTFVCLDMLEETEELTGNIFFPEKLEREELICDMEKLGNMLRSVGEYLAYEV